MHLIKKLLVVIIFSLQLLTAIGQQKTPVVDTAVLGKNNLAGKYINTRGFKLYYETYGQGEPLLIIHGNGGSINNFINQVPYFAKNYQVIIADSRAQGKSTDKGDSLSYEMMTDDLNALLDTLHLNACNVIGWSDGGINGLLLAIHHPEKVKKLAITGANLWPDTTAIDPFVYNWAMNLNKPSNKNDTTPQLKNQRKLNYLLAYEPHITIEQLHTIKCPTLVMSGDHDVILPRHSLLIAESIAQSYLWILPNSGHSTPINYKNQFNEVVNDFFTKPYRKIEGYGKFN